MTATPRTGAGSGTTGRCDHHAETTEILRGTAAGLRMTLFRVELALHDADGGATHVGDPVAAMLDARPDLAREICTRVLGPVLALGEADRNLLLDMFGVWLESGSALETAELPPQHGPEPAAEAGAADAPVPGGAGGRGGPGAGIPGVAGTGRTWAGGGCLRPSGFGQASRRRGSCSRGTNRIGEDPPGEG